MTENKNDKKPTHTIYRVLGDGPTAEWTKIGVAFPHKDGKGLAMTFDEGATTEGRMALRVIRPKAQAATHLTVPVYHQVSLPIVLPDPLKRAA